MNKLTTWLIITISFIAFAGAIYFGYNLKHCPTCPEPIPPQIPPPIVQGPPVIIHDTIKIKQKINENNPYISKPVPVISVFDSIAKYYGK